MKTAMTRKSTATGRLPRLESAQPGSPQDLRGANYSKLKDRHKSQQSREKVMFLPILDGDEEHPLPYYTTGEVAFPALAEVPWKTDEKRKLRAQAEIFNRDTRLQDALLEDLISDTIMEEIVATASVVLQESKYQEEEDQVIAGLIEEVLVMPEVQQQVYIIAWSLLYDTGRSLPHQEFLDLKKREEELHLEPVAKEALLAHVLEGEDWADDLKEEKILSEISWDILVFNYHRNLQENALSKNYALKILQEKMVSQAAGEEVFRDGLLDNLEEEFNSFDELEKLTAPPRMG
ncbi:uncharacterized protein LOC125045073 isoform X1 [Penaeus chinensis]|uniref:uncharacterized protein LOC125045073 isoform X1 n=1 Tax=Penaeus chinensis TaxID=139456 RepID=UPI001FB680EA|nr:uncharacterized protein LOC125045073 isoform X1 [Penaeus chinensis]